MAGNKACTMELWFDYEKNATIVEQFSSFVLSGNILVGNVVSNHV